MPAIKHRHADKGGRVEIIGGKYKGLFGWKHLTANTFPAKQWIIVEQSAQNPVEKACLLMKTNFTDSTPETEEDVPTSFEIALLKEHREVKSDMHALAKKLATFIELDPMDGKEMMMVLWSMWVVESRKLEGLNHIPNARIVRSWRNNPNNSDPPVRNVHTPNRASRRTSNMSTGTTATDADVDDISLPDYDAMWESQGNNRVVSDDEDAERNARRAQAANSRRPNRRARNENQGQ